MDAGRFPRSFLAPTDADSAVWSEQFIRTYLERDIPAQTLRRFWTMLAHLQGGLWNAASLARSLDRAFIVHGGEDRYPKGSGVEAVGLRELADELAG